MAHPVDAPVTDPPNARLGRVLAGRYKLIRVIGTGGMGAVFEAVHTSTDKHVAIKLLAPGMSRDLKLVARFRREALAASRLNQENCVRVDDFGQDDVDGSFYIAMELIHGRGLADELQAHGPMPAGRVVAIGVQLLTALDVAHGAGVLHRDLKPQNIMLVKRGSKDIVKVVDFGIAKITTDPLGGASLDSRGITVPGTIFGTPEYMSPEQARGEDLDARSDVYSAAVVLWHMLVGRSPFRGDSVKDTLLKVFTAELPSLAVERPTLVCPEGLEAILRRGMARDKATRFPDAVSFLERLVPFVDGPPPAVARSRPLPGLGVGAPAATLDKLPAVTAAVVGVALPAAPPSARAVLAAVTAPAQALALPPPLPTPAPAPPSPSNPAPLTRVLSVAAAAEELHPGGPEVTQTPLTPAPVRRRRGGGMQAPMALAFAAGGGLLVAFGFSLAWVLQQSQGPAVVSGPSPDPVSTRAAAPQAALFDTDLPLDAAAREAALDRAASAVADGRTAEARAAYEDALRADPTAPRALAGLGTLAMQRRDWATASECYGKLIELDETYRRQFGAMYARARKLAASRP